MRKISALHIVVLLAVADSYAAQRAPIPRAPVIVPGAGRVLANPSSTWKTWQFPSSTALPSVNLRLKDRTLELPVPEALPRIMIVRSPFVRVWGEVYERVTRGIEGQQENSGGLAQKVTLYTITRVENGITRRIIARDLETRSRHPNIPDFFQRRLFLERKDGNGSVFVEIDENGELVSGPRDGFEREFTWWQENLSDGR